MMAQFTDIYVPPCRNVSMYLKKHIHSDFFQVTADIIFICQLFLSWSGNLDSYLFGRQSLNATVKDYSLMKLFVGLPVIAEQNRL